MQKVDLRKIFTLKLVTFFQKPEKPTLAGCFTNFYSGFFACLMGRVFCANPGLRRLHDAEACILYTQRHLFEILLNQTETRLYLPFSG